MLKVMWMLMRLNQCNCKNTVVEMKMHLFICFYPWDGKIFLLLGVKSMWLAVVFNTVVSLNPLLLMFLSGSELKRT